MNTSATRRVALVSGASRGIGLAIARELLAHGWCVSAGTRTPVAALADQTDDHYHWARFDACDSATESVWVQSAHKHFGRIDAIVHNAGILSSQSVIDATADDFDAIFEVNVKSPMRLTQHVWPHLQASTGKVIMVASLAGKRVRAAEAGLYSMSKAAALMLAHGIRHAGDRDGIRCTAICPGFVATDMADGVDEDVKGQLTQPTEVAKVVRMALELPATASVAEIPVNWRVESEY